MLDIDVGGDLATGGFQRCMLAFVNWVELGGLVMKIVRMVKCKMFC